MGIFDLNFRKENKNDNIKQEIKEANAENEFRERMVVQQVDEVLPISYQQFDENQKKQILDDARIIFQENRMIDKIQDLPVKTSGYIGRTGFLTYETEDKFRMEKYVVSPSTISRQSMFKENGMLEIFEERTSSSKGTTTFVATPTTAKSLTKDAKSEYIEMAKDVEDGVDLQNFWSGISRAIPESVCEEIGVPYVSLLEQLEKENQSAQEKMFRVSKYQKNNDGCHLVIYIYSNRGAYINGENPLMINFDLEDIYRLKDGKYISDSSVKWNGNTYSYNTHELAEIEERIRIESNMPDKLSPRLENAIRGEIIPHQILTMSKDVCIDQNEEER